jgi:hypothetical protein
LRWQPQNSRCQVRSHLACALPGAPSFLVYSHGHVVTLLPGAPDIASTEAPPRRIPLAEAPVAQRPDGIDVPAAFALHYPECLVELRVGPATRVPAGDEAVLYAAAGARGCWWTGGGWRRGCPGRHSRRGHGSIGWAISRRWRGRRRRRLWCRGGGGNLSRSYGLGRRPRRLLQGMEANILARPQTLLWLPGFKDASAAGEEMNSIAGDVGTVIPLDDSFRAG